MEIGRHDLLARHQEHSGLLKGKIVSDTVIPIRSYRKLLEFQLFDLPDTPGAFKRFCQTARNVGVKDHQRLPLATQSFIESWYRGLSKYGAMALYLTYKSGDNIYLAIKATGHWDPSRYQGGREGQMAFDDMAHHASPEINGVYRTRRYSLAAVFFSDRQTAQRFTDRLASQNAGYEERADELWNSLQAQTRCVSARIPEKWFSGGVNHHVPQQFADSLDEEALRFLFPPGMIKRLLGLRHIPGKVNIAPEHKQMMLTEVKRQYHGVNPTNSTEELLNIYSNLPDAVEVPYTRELAMSVKMKCDFVIELREPSV